jgi:hypothetical protein
MLSLDYVKEHISEIEFDDMFDRRFTKRFCSFLTIDEAKQLGFNYQCEGGYIPKEWTEENIIAQLKEDLNFTIEKAINHRGISSSLMHDVLKSWCIVLENGLENTGYGWYGDKLIKAIDESYGFGLYVEDAFIESRIQHLKDSIITMLHDAKYEFHIDNGILTVDFDNIGTAKIQITKGE